MRNGSINVYQTNVHRIRRHRPDGVRTRRRADLASIITAPEATSLAKAMWRPDGDLAGPGHDARRPTPRSSPNTIRSHTTWNTSTTTVPRFA
ncbi:MAG: hypothetical protein MZU97_12905 [Bacillus subtilis]|nr:hypothetical protein [Bacillus subtilis]